MSAAIAHMRTASNGTASGSQRITVGLISFDGADDRTPASDTGRS
jgi:hypothetical protein